MYIHTRAPTRVGIAGGGTDLPVWTSSREGLCLNLAIKTYTHAVLIGRPDGGVVASYRKLDSAPSVTEIANGLIRETALMYGQTHGFEVHTLSEVSSSGSGLGASSSLAVCLAAAFYKKAEFDGGVLQPEDEGFRKDILRGASEAEINRLLRPIGRQDHVAAVWGGLRLYRFEQDQAEIAATYTEEQARWLANNLTLIRLNEGHDSRSILSGVNKTEQLELAYAAVPGAIYAVEHEDISKLGDALWSGQKSKMNIRGAVPRWLHGLIDIVMSRTGVYGCKVAGAGGGGHLVVACDPEIRQDLTEITGLSVFGVEPDFHGLQSELWP